MRRANSVHPRIDDVPAPIPFPQGPRRGQSPSSAAAAPTRGKSFLPESVDDVLAAFDDMSRSITNLARELNCLGYFEDPNGDLPRAA